MNGGKYMMWNLCKKCHVLEMWKGRGYINGSIGLEKKVKDACTKLPCTTNHMVGSLTTKPTSALSFSL